MSCLQRLSRWFEKHLSGRVSSHGDGSAVPNSGKKRKKKVIAASVLAVLFVLAGIFTWYVNDYYTPQTLALEALQPGDDINVYQRDNMTVFEPVAFSRELGVIFYPGGKVDARAYAPVLREIAQAGYRVVVLDMPFRLAVLAPNRGTVAIEEFADTEGWVLIGHSLGGAMGSRFAANNPSDVRGLVLWASYPAGDISTTELAVLSVYGTRDGLATVEKVLDSRENLPSDAVFIPIYGGNHANFGAYGPQDGDLAPYITQKEQHRLVAEATIEFLRSLGR